MLAHGTTVDIIENQQNLGFASFELSLVGLKLGQVLKVYRVKTSTVVTELSPLEGIQIQAYTENICRFK